MFEDAVGIGAPVAEGIHASPFEQTGRPASRFGHDLHPCSFEVDGRIQIDDARRRWYAVVLESKYTLDDSGDAACTFAVAEIGLDGSDQQRTDTRGSEYAANGSYLDRVAYRSPGPVAFKIAGVLR